MDSGREKRPECRNGSGCHQKNPEHKVMFKHPPGWNPGEHQQKPEVRDPLSMYGYGSSSEHSNNSDSDYNRMLKQKATQIGSLDERVQAAVNAATNAVGGGGFGSSKSAPQPSDSPNDRRPDCRNGAGCHQKNPEHKVMFRHPPGWVPGAGSEPATSWKKQGGGPMRGGGGGSSDGGSDRRPDCRNGAGCSQPNPEHKVMFRHPPNWDPRNPVRGGEDRRGMCKYLGECTQKNPEHQVMFKHPPGWTPHSKEWQRGEYGQNSNNENNYNANAQQYYQEQLRKYQEMYPGHDPAKMIQYPGYSGYGNSNGSGSGNGSSSYESMTYEQQWAQWHQWQQHQQQGSTPDYSTAKINTPLPPMPPKSDDNWKYENPGDKRVPWNRNPNGSIPPPSEPEAPARNPADKRPPCRLGAECPVVDEDEEHKVMFWHPEPTGPGGKTFSAAMEYYKKNADFIPKEDERGPFAEPGKVDKRPYCRYDRGCKHSNPEHQMMFQHPPGWVPPPPLPEVEPAPPGLEDEHKKAKETKRRIVDEDKEEEYNKKSKKDYSSE